MNNLFGTLSGLFTGLLILIFVGLFAWAWSSRRRADFDATARLPLEEDTAPPARTDREQLP